MLDSPEGTDLFIYPTGHAGCNSFTYFILFVFIHALFNMQRNTSVENTAMLQYCKYKKFDR